MNTTILNYHDILENVYRRWYGMDKRRCNLVKMLIISKTFIANLHTSTTPALIRKPKQYMVDSFEKIPCSIFPDLKKGSLHAARMIAQLIKEKQARNETCVLGLATGSTPKTLYAELVRMHQEESLSF